MTTVPMLATTTTVPAALRRARASTAAIFGFNGFLFAAWVPHIPQVKSDLGLSNAALGLALLGSAVGSLLMMALIGRFIARYGSARMTAVLALLSYVLAVGPGLAVDLPTLFLAMAGWGASIGALDVAMNAQAVQIETAYRRPIMSSFHGFWSVGTVVGTGAGSLGSGLHLPVAAQQSGLGIVLAACTLWCIRQLIGDQQSAPHPPGKRSFELRLVLLGVAGLCALLAEGSSADWSPVYLRDDLHVSAGSTGLAFAAFTVMMTLGRLIGDRIVLRLGRGRSLALSSFIGVAGSSVGLVVNTVPAAAVGFGCLGLGLSVMVPVFFSTAADGPGETGSKLAAVSGVGYFGFLLGPASLGPIANATSVHTALWLLPAFAALAGVLGVTAVRMTARLT